MRVVHVAPRRHRGEDPFEPAVVALARAQAKASGYPVQVAAAADEAQSVRLEDIELRAFASGSPRRLGRSRTLRHHLAKCPLELIHAHCPGQRGLHYAFVAAQRHGAPLVISPGGEFGLGPAERLRLRCAFHRLATHPQALEQAAGWHATSAEEAAAIHACGFEQPVCVAPRGIPIPSAAALDTYRKWWRHRLPKLGDRPIALCTDPLKKDSRLVELIARWGDSFTADWLLLIVGKPGDVAPELLAATARRHGAGDRVLVVTPDEAPPYAIGRLFVSATGNPNNVDRVSMALASGLPVLVADQTPWSRLGADGVGWCVPWKDYGNTLKTILARGPDELATIGRGARDLARREFDWAHTAEVLLGFYRHLRA